LAVDSRKMKLLAGAEKYALQGKIRQAIAEYLKVIETDPEDNAVLNTIGDLYLRQSDGATANRYFLRVAENYAEGGFFLKAIAVYKKVLNSNPDDCALISKIALLYTRQGLAMEACAQYTRVIELLEKTGREREALEFYEKIVELDPSDIAAQKKLALRHQEAGDLKRAQVYWSGAARAQMKAGNFSEAMESWRNVLAADSFDTETRQGFVDCCLKMGEPDAALEPLRKSSETNPADLDLKDLLGQVHLARGDCDEALAVAQSILAADGSRYENFFAVGRALLGKEAYDQAASCLDTIIPTLLSHQEAGRLVEYYRAILERNPRHELTLIKLASVYSASGDQAGYLQTLRTLADCYMADRRPIEALEYIEKILQADPGDEKYRQLHKDVFAEAYPDMAYTPPATIRREAPVAPDVDDIAANYRASGDGGVASIREVDLLLDYGLPERALGLLQRLESENPGDREVHRRLLSLYKASRKNREAAEQCLLLAFLYRGDANEVLTKNCLIEAGQLSPEFAATNVDLEQFARQHGILPEGGGPTAGDGAGDLDLASTLAESLFANEAGSARQAAGGSPEAGRLDIPLMELEALDGVGTDDAEPDVLDMPDTVLPDGFAAPEKSLAERLQEVDLYINLGFGDEALSRLNDIARNAPDHPEIRARYRQLCRETPASVATPTPAAPEPAAQTATPEDPLEKQMAAAQSKREQDFGMGTFLDGQTDHLVARREEKAMAAATPAPVPAPEPDAPASPAAPAAAPVEAAPVPAPPTPPAPSAQAVPPAEPAQAAPAAEAATPMPPPPTPEAPPKVNDMFADLLEELSAPVDPALADASFEEHFSMGVAFSEMELMDEAVREFEAAVKAIDLRRGDERALRCCERLSHCFLRKNMPTSALRWCQTGLNLTEKFSHEDMAFRYDMGVAHALAGDADRALDCFEQVFRMDPGHRDVAQRIDGLKGGLQKHAV